MRALRVARVVVAPLSALAGTVFVVGLVLVMNGVGPSRDATAEQSTTTFQVEPQKKKPKTQRKPKPKPKPKAARPPPPAPLISANLSGLSFGIEALEGMGAAGDLEALLGDVRDVVMTEDAVDDPPVPLSQVPPTVPDRAIKRGITGKVTLSMLVGVDGRVTDVRVLEAQPPGVFEQAATDAVRQWTFQPARYEGRAVAIRVTQTLRFGHAK